MSHQPAEDRYERQSWRRAGETGLVLPEFAFGLWQKFGDRTPYETQREILLAAFDAGIVHFDNANRYGPPHRAAEKNFGRLLREDLGQWRDELILTSKAGNPVGPSPYHRGGSRKTLLQSLDHSLRDLGTDYVDVFYFHRPDPTTPLEETVGALVSAVHSGKALYVGISNFTDRDEARRAAALLRESGVPLALHQARYSIFDRTLEREDLLGQAQEDGVGLVAYSPLAQGLLTDKYLDGVPAGARALDSDFLATDDITEEYRDRARALNTLALARGQSLAQLALQWVLRRPEVTSALIGASSVAQLEHNLRAPGFPPLTEEELAVIDEHGVHGTGLRSR